MAGARTVTSLAGYARNQLVQLKRRVEQRRGAVAAKAVFRFIAVNVPPRRLLQARWWTESISYSPVQSVDGRVIAHAALVELFVVAEENWRKWLLCLALTEPVQNCRKEAHLKPHARGKTGGTPGDKAKLSGIQHGDRDIPFDRNYFSTTPWPSITVRIRSTPRATISSFFPLGQ